MRVRRQPWGPKVTSWDQRQLGHPMNSRAMRVSSIPRLILTVGYPPKPLQEERSRDTAHPKAEESSGVSWFREALPFELRIETGSIVLGSDATPMLLIADFSGAKGIVEVTDVSCVTRFVLTTVPVSFRLLQVVLWHEFPRCQASNEDQCGLYWVALGSRQESLR